MNIFPDILELTIFLYYLLAFIIKCKNAEQFLAEELSKLNPESMILVPKNQKLEIVLVKQEYDNEDENENEEEDTIEENLDYQDPSFEIENDDNEYESEDEGSSEYLIQYPSKDSSHEEEGQTMEPNDNKIVPNCLPIAPGKMLKMEMDVYEDTIENDVIINRSRNKFSMKVYECQYCKKVRT